eukprot:TRINITY_DN173_c0_g1_i1.p2 TRINITY_DN173_c0_g1~~TRINITY_DN173_c0_g1_i1.p2  ORF type:complete len:226 (+),score=44.29 TRINITY_DN173_c0_g1_i1:3-680(+)
MAAAAEESFVPALGFKPLNPFYQTVVDVFNRDTHVKQLVLECIEGGRNLEILDMACGPGKLVAMLAAQQQCCRITGMDIDPSMVQRARETTQAANNVTIVEGDATRCPFANDVYDVVIESLMFHHLSDPQKRDAIGEAARVVKPGGLFYFVDWVQPNTLYAKLAFNLVKAFDGAENVRAHASNEVLEMIGEQLDQVEVVATINTAFGTMAIVVFQRPPASSTDTD